MTIAHEFATAMALLRHHGEMTEIEWFDCEGLERRHTIGRGTLVVLDAIIQGSYFQRRECLLSAFPSPLPTALKPPENAAVLTPSFPASDAAAVYANLRTINREWGCDFYEGLVMKRGDAEYPIQLRSATEEWGAWCKHRFIT